MKAPKAAIRVVALAILFLLPIAPAVLCSADEHGAGDSGLEVLSISGNLEQARPSSIMVLLQNNGPSREVAEEYGLGDANPSSIVAALHSSDDRIKILSGPQFAGSLAPGENRSLQFTAFAKGAQVGVYPLILKLNCSRLSSVAATGEQSLPDLVFVYQKIAQEIPLQVGLIAGPKIEANELLGTAVPGRESELEIVLANQGDEAASDLQVQAYPQQPFLSIQNSGGQIVLRPAESARTKLQVFTDENASPGYYALPCKVFYRDGELHSQEIAMVVPVNNDGLNSWLILPAAILLLLAGVILGAKGYFGQKKKMHRSLVRLKR
ncbi:Uncharacterised protein [uncultured archaeon]|nr:Uncharacterised protein [uncultured archaeon]